MTGSDTFACEGTSHGEHQDGPWRAGVPEWAAGRWCDVFEVRDWLIQRCFIYLDPDYAGEGHRPLPVAGGLRLGARPLGRRDDDRGRGARPARRHGLLRRASACRRRRPTSPAGCTRPTCVLVYESGCIGSKPTRLPLSIGDGELAETADAVVSVPEIFAYWLQAGRVDLGFLGAAQIDRFGNINSTVIGPYDAPDVRLPGAGGAPEIAASAGEVFVMLRQTARAFVERLRLPHLGRLRRRPRRRVSGSACAGGGRRS